VGPQAPISVVIIEFSSGSLGFRIKAPVYRIDFMQNGQGQLSGQTGASMKGIFLLLVISAFAISPAAAASKQKSKQAAEAEEIAKQHDNTLRALRDSLPLFLPTWSLPVYFNLNKDAKTEKPQKTAKRKK
jgi:hypothetical protein